MSILTEEQAKAILDKVLALSQADECTATLTGSVDGNIRFALNQVSTSGIVSNAQLVVQSAFGKREGITTINSFDDASLERVVRRSEELARLAPENPEYMPAVGKQAFKPSPTFVQATADVTPEQRAQVAAASIGPCKDNKLIAAGFLQDGQSFQAFANNKGNFGYARATNLDYTCTVRTADGRGSGWVARNASDIGQFDAGDDIQVAIQKARDSAEAKALEPGKYTVILEPAASAHPRVARLQTVPIARIARTRPKRSPAIESGTASTPTASATTPVRLPSWVSVSPHSDFSSGNTAASTWRDM